MKRGEVVAFSSDHVVRQPRPALRKSMLGALAGLTLAAILAVVPGNAQAQQGTISGTVLVEGAQRPLPGAQVSVEGQADKNAVTDGSGRFRLSGLTGTTVNVSVRALGYRPLTESVTVGSNNV